MSINPITRLESILAGKDVEPVTRLEYLLEEVSASSLPEITENDEGKFLKVENENAVWGEGGIPSITESDEGKVLMVDNGEAIWGEGGGGGGELFEIVYSPATLTGVSSSSYGIRIVLTDAPAPVYNGPYYSWTIEGITAEAGGLTFNYLPSVKWQYVRDSIKMDNVETGNSIYVTLDINNDDVFRLSSDVYTDGITATITGFRIAKSKDDKVEQIDKSNPIQQSIPN